MNIYLYVKTHRKTGLKYLGMTTKSDPHKYAGSGKMWKQHLKEHGMDYDTTILLESNNKEEIKEKGVYYSKLWNVVKSQQWANQKIESGSGGWTPQSGRVPWNKGRPMDEVQKNKISKTKKGKFIGENNPFFNKKHTSQTKQQISQKNKGRVFDAESVLKRNDKQKGVPKPTVSEKLKGKPKSSEHKEKMRQAWIKRKEFHNTRLHSPPGYSPS